jgi:hypothetical protein
MRHVCSLFLLVSFSVLSTAQTKSTSLPVPKRALGSESSDSSSSARLPVRRVVLYKNGIGYFEHTARVHGTQDLNIDFTTGQLNDVLKSLTVVDLGQGQIASVRYNSIAPLDERLRSLRLPFGEQVSSAEYLQALRGARVDVRSGAASATGRLLSVEKERKQNGKGDYMDVTTVAVVTSAGEMRNFQLGPGTSIRLADRDLNDEVGRYLNLVGTARARDSRRMTISATGSGDREVFVSYISEVPVWKSTYRIILPDKPGEKPLLQGWAIVDNTVGEDWRDVQLSLVAGAPQSFIQDISQPYYTRRPVVAPPEALMLSPQTHQVAMSAPLEVGTPASMPLARGLTGLQGVVKDPSGAVMSGVQVTVRNEETGTSQTATTDANGNYRFYNVQAGNSAVFVNAPGFKRFNLTNAYLGVGRINEINATLEIGNTADTIEVRGQSLSMIQTETATLGALASGQRVEAESKDVGDYFEYNIKQKITISKNQSALVPILNSPVEVEKVSLWNGDDKEVRRALWLKNTSGLTVDSGTFNILESDTFAGEGVLDTLHSGERRLISYAADPAVHMKVTQEDGEKPVSHLRIAKGVMVLTHEQNDTHEYIVRNADKSPRQIVIEHPARDGWKLVDGAPKPEETTASFLRFRLNVAPGATEHLTVTECHPDEAQFEIDDFDDKKLALLVESKSLTPDALQAIRKVLDQKNVVDHFGSEIGSRQHEVDAIGKDQARVRENMKALKGSSEERALLQRYAHQLDQQEDRLNVLQKEISDLNDKKDKADEKLDRIIQGIVMDETLIAEK